MAKVYFLFGIHDHQPVGNFDHVFDMAFNSCYSPFINVLKEFPGVKCNIHISGPLYDWILENRKDYIKIIKELVGRGQVEMVGGGYYEPILPLISDADKLAQLNLMSGFLKKKFGRAPRAMWCTERVWEPYLARIINEAGLKATFLDDTHFRYAGLRGREFFGYYLTEDSLKPVNVFPISKTLRYKIPFSQPKEAVDILKGFGSGSCDRLVTLFDDGEKFGLWPHTFDWVYKQEWLRKFFSLLERNAGSVETITVSRALEQFSPSGIVYLPTASYQEMGEWVLDPEGFFTYERLRDYLRHSPENDKYQDFVRGGFFRNFYRKYPRLNYMHKRMLSVSERINRSTCPEKDKKIFNFLWKSQCNCAYWHGVFGGFYLGHIRSAIYENLIRAEKEFDSKYVKEKINAESGDINLDGREEMIFRNEKIICVVDKNSGRIHEVSLKDPAFNFGNTITRREESYHKKVKQELNSSGGGQVTIHDIACNKEDGLADYLVYDNYEKVSLVEHVLEPGITIAEFNRQQKSVFLPGEFYRAAYKKGKKHHELDCRFAYNGMEFIKKLKFYPSSKIGVEYDFTGGKFLPDRELGVEFNLFFPSPQDVTVNGDPFMANEHRVLKGMTTLEIKDMFKKVKVFFETTVSDVFIYPLYSVSSSESGFERVYQQMVILFINRECLSGKFNLSFGLEKEV